MDSIILPKNFSVDKVVFDDKIRSLDTGSKMKYISYNKNPLVLQTPECYLPYGITNNTMDEENTNRYAMDMSFRDLDSRPSLKKFFDALKAMDDLIVTEAFKNQKEWLRKSYPSKEVVEALYVPMIKYAKDKDTGEITDAYPPTFKMKVPYGKDKFMVDFFNYEGESMPGMDVVKMNTKGARSIALVKCNGLWFAGGKFGCSWKAIQIQIAPKLNPTGGCAIKMCSEDNLNNESSDEEDDDDEEEDY